ncbi:MAG TPA: hypothetical protein VN428_26995 [Bryobacteraceae bacterium]|nr:hypothetical protein [Bryobacteraceae bacterium]
MDIVGGRKYVEIAGDKLHELPPLLVRSCPGMKRPDKIVELAEMILESEHMLEEGPGLDVMLGEEVQRRKMDLAVSLVEEYKALIAHWRWGDSILEWIRHCEATFEMRPELRGLLHPDVWPHAGRTSFVNLLEDKAVADQSVDVEKAVGMRLTFRHPPPISFFSDQFLFYLKHSLAEVAYRKWSEMSPPPIAALPPERFRFEVVDMA